MTGAPTAAKGPSDGTRLGVLGWPVAHSRSPAIQNAALAAVGLVGWRYQLLPAPPQLFDELVAGLPGAGFRGANVTIPHKGAALALASVPTARAQAIGAANTLVFERGAVLADNTDAPALIEALPFAAAGASAVVLGAGGTARAAVWALRDAGAEPVWIWNRTPERARALADEMGAIAVDRPGPADLLVNCTSVGMDGRDPFAALPVSAPDLGGYRCVVDYVYGGSPTALCIAAGAAGAAIVDGLKLLVGQGALSFTQFTACVAPLAAMRAAAR